MARNHRKLFPLLSETNQSIDCSTGLCDTACPDNCYAYSEYPIISPEQPPPLLSPSLPAAQQEFPNTPSISDAITIISVASVVLIVLLAGIVFAAKFKFSRRNGFNRRQDGTHVEARDDFLDEGQADHPIWFIRTTGLQQSIIDSITICRYRKGEGLIEGADCPVCLNEFEEYEALRLLPKCNHAFHISCIDTWLASHTNCPLCRASIVTTAASQTTSLVDASPQISSSQIEHSEDEDVDGERNLSQSENRDEPERNQDETTNKEPVSSSCGNSANSETMESSCFFDESDQNLEVGGINQYENWDERDGEGQSRVSGESPISPDVDNSVNFLTYAKSQTENTDFPGKSYLNQNQEPRRMNQSEDAFKPETETYNKTIGEEASYSNSNCPDDLQSRRRFDSMDSGEWRTSDDTTAKSHSAISSSMLKLTGSSSTSCFNRSKTVFPLQ